jgi:hypothetical protein
LSRGLIHSRLTACSRIECHGVLLQTQFVKEESRGRGSVDFTGQIDFAPRATHVLSPSESHDRKSTTTRSFSIGAAAGTQQGKTGEWRAAWAVGGRRSPQGRAGVARCPFGLALADWPAKGKGSKRGKLMASRIRGAGDDGAWLGSNNASHVRIGTSLSK